MWGMTTPHSLATHPAFVAATESTRLLVVSDFDGTLAGFDPDPYAVHAHPGSLQALRELSGLSNTTVGVLSGRHVAGLEKVCPLEPPILLVGSHGAEDRDGATVPLTAKQQNFLDDVGAELEALAAQHPGTYVENKPFQRVFHVAPLAVEDPAAAQEILERARQVAARGFPVTPGKNLVEFSALEITKGTWLQREKQRLQADAVVFLGDDVTDENAFTVLGPDDVGIKVGAGATCAGHRVTDIDEVANVLQDLAARRGRYLARA